MSALPSPSPTRRRRSAALPVTYLCIGVVGALGGARPTGIGWLDPALLGLGGMAAAACAIRARTLPVYVAAGLAAALQPELAPAALGVVALGAAMARRFNGRRSLVGAVAGGLAWAAAVGVPFQPGARPIVVPMLGFLVMAWSAHRHGSRRFRRRSSIIAVAAGALAVVGGGLGLLSVATARTHLERGADLVDDGLAAARAGDTEAAVAHLRGARRALRDGEASLGAIWARPAWLVPGVSQNARALHTVVTEVDSLAAVAIDTAETADIQALRASAGQVDLAAVAATEEPLARVLSRLRGAESALDDLEDSWLLPPVRSRLQDVRAELADAIPPASLALDGVRVAPQLLGAEGPRTYLVLFTTPVEARATSGFPGNYAEITFTDGRFDMPRFGRISELDPEPGAALRTVSGPPDFLARYARFGADQDWRNLTMSPDFPSVAAVAAELYPQSGGRAIDGVMTVDPTALAALMEFTGPIAVPGVDEVLTSENAAQFLLRDQYVELPDNPRRVDMLETLSEVAFERLQTADLPGPRQLGEVLGPIVERKHLQVVAFGDAAEAFVDELGVSGRYPAVEGDFLGVTTTNAAGNKIDLFLRRSLAYDVQWDPSTGQVSGTVTVTLTNEAPATGLPAYLIGNALGRRPLEAELPDGWNNVFLTIYTPWADDGVTLDGQPTGIERMDELGRQAYSTFVAVPPGGTRTLVLQLTGQIDDHEYVLDLAAQPSVIPEDVAVDVRVVGGGDLRTTGPVDTAQDGASGAFPLLRDERLSVARG